MEKLTINGPCSIAMLNYQRVYPLKLTSLGHWRLQCLRPTAAKRRLSSKFTISTGALPEHCWHPNSHPSIHRIDMNWSIFALLNLTSDDSMRRNISLILHIGSWVSKKSPPLQMSKIWINSKTGCFNKTCCVDHDKDAPEITTLELQGNFEEGNATSNIHWNLEPRSGAPISIEPGAPISIEPVELDRIEHL